MLQINTGSVPESIFFLEQSGIVWTPLDLKNVVTCVFQAKIRLFQPFFSWKYFNSFNWLFSSEPQTPISSSQVELCSNDILNSSGEKTDNSCLTSGGAFWTGTFVADTSGCVGFGRCGRPRRNGRRVTESLRRQTARLWCNRKRYRTLRERYFLLLITISTRV